MKLAIKQWRKARGMTQQMLAETLGKSRSLISEYESGSVGVGADVLYAIAQILEVSVDDLYDTEDTEEHADDA